MPTVKEVALAIEEIAPRALAETWDNVGLLVECGTDVTGVLVCLDITDEVVDEAQALSCSLIVAHHPVIFHPLRSITKGDVVQRLVRKGISAVAAHTNLDAAPGGVNDILAEVFGLDAVQPFAAVGRVGRLPHEMAVSALAEQCAEVFRAHVRFVDGGRPVQTLAVLGGSGGGLLPEVLAAGADCLLTGEADHHDAIDARQAGVSLVVAGHFSTEFPVVPVMADWLARRFPGVPVHKSRAGRDPFAYLAPK